MSRCPLLAIIAVCSAPAASQETTTFEYDALGRLKSTSTANGPNDQVRAEIEYDPAGNRTTYRVSAGTSPVGTPQPPATVDQRPIVLPLNGFTAMLIPIQQ